MKPRLSPTAVLAAALAVAACVALGYWQLDRAHEKQALIDGFRHGDETIVDVTARPIAGLPRYQAVSLRGQYEPARQVLIDNMPSATGQPGYRVLTPFRRSDGGTLQLVDRGWVPLGASRDQLPAVDVAATAREISGRLDHPPEPGLRLGSARGPTASGWPRVLNFPTTADLAVVLGEPVEPMILLLHPGAPDGYERNWQPALRLGPERHLAYAIQWFALAIIVAVAVLVTGLRRRTPRVDAT